MPDETPVTWELGDDHVGVITLNRPEARNALSTPAQWAEVVDACEVVVADTADPLPQALVLTAIYGDNYAFDDQTGSRDKLPERHFTSFKEAADQAGISRLYGGIHFRAAIENGLAQGRCIGAYAVNLKTWK